MLQLIYHNHNLVGNCKLVEMVGIDIVVDSKAVEVGNMIEAGIEAGIEVFVGSWHGYTGDSQLPTPKPISPCLKFLFS